MPALRPLLTATVALFLLLPARPTRAAVDPAALAAARALFNERGKSAEAQKAFEALAAVDPKNADANFFLGQLANRRDDPEKAVTYFEQALATLYVGEKKYAEALAQFDEVLKVSPDDYAALYQVGRLAAVTGQYLDRGLISLRRCLELPVPNPANTPSHAAAHWRIGVILEQKKDLPGARSAYEAAVQLDPAFTPAADSLKKLK